MSLIDKTYFIRSINIPDSNWSNLDGYITQFEKEILMKLLGYKLWKLVKAYDATTSPQEIIDLVQGKEYNDIKWNGLINDDKISLIAYYVYYQWVRDNQVKIETTGAVQSYNENSESASPVMTLSQAWQNLKELYGYPGQDENVASAFNFLSYNQENYPDWDFSQLGDVNAFDL